MLEQILVYLKNHPYSRIRYIMYDLRLPRMAVVSSLATLKEDGYISYRTHKDNANMEFYDEWFII